MTAKMDNGNDLDRCENGRVEKDKSKKKKEKRDVKVSSQLINKLIINCTNDLALAITFFKATVLLLLFFDYYLYGSNNKPVTFTNCCTV